MYVIFINLICFMLAFYGNGRKRKTAFKVFLLFNFGEYLLFNQSGFAFSFTEFYSIVAMECFLLSLLILKIYGIRKGTPFYVFNLLLSFMYLFNIYLVKILNVKDLWRFIFSNQEIIGFVSVLLLMDVRVVKNVVRKYFFSFKRRFVSVYVSRRVHYHTKMDKASK